MVGNFRVRVGMLVLGLSLCLVFPAGAKLNTALAFNGLNASVDTGTAVIPASGDYTVEFSYYSPAAVSASQTILSQGNLFYIGTDAANNLRVGDNWQPTGVTLPVGGWHHLALVQSSTNTILYLDGTNWVSRGTSLGNPGATSFRLGCQSGANAEFWRGSLDDVRVWNVVRSEEEIRTNRFTTLTGVEPGLVADWQMDEGRGTNITAIGSSPITGVLINGPRWVPGWVWTPNVQLVGANPLAHQIHTAFADPGIAVTIPRSGIAAGGDFSLAWAADGTVRALKNNGYSQGDTPNGDASSYGYTQVKIPESATNIVAIEAGDSHVLMLKADGTVVAGGWHYWFNTSFSFDDVSESATNVVAIAAGNSHSLALRADGTVVAWGDNDYGQTNVPESVVNVVAIAAGNSHSLALKADGTVVAWGDNDYGQTNVPESVVNVVAIAAGDSHSLALKADGTVVAWGDNDYGQTDVPMSATNIVAMAAGRNHSLALKADGTVVAWGAGFYYQTNVPASVTNVVAIAARFDHSLALKADGSVVGWGNNNPYDQFSVPVASQVLPAINGTVNTEVAGDYTLAYSFTNSFGEVISTNRTVVVGERPIIVSQPVNVVALAGSPAQLVVAATGTPSLSYQWYRVNSGAIAGATNAALEWGELGTNDAGIYYVVVRNTFGPFSSRQVLVAPLNWQLTGENPQTNFLHLPFIDPGITLPLPILAIAESGGHGLALKMDGAVAAWGNGDHGLTNVPAQAANSMAIAAGGRHNLALQSDGTVVAWGDNYDGQSDVPTSAKNIVAIAAGDAHCLALKADGTVVAWGWNSDGQTNVPAAATNIVAIAGGGFHSLALQSDGTVVAWGRYNERETVIPDQLANVVAIAGGKYHSLALKADGAVVAWGLNDLGQTNVPESATNVMAIAAGWGHSLALRQDGSVVTWGDNTYGQLDVPAAATNIVAIAAGGYNSLALKADGRVIGWGDNTYGQTNVPAFTQTLLATSGRVNTEVAGAYTLTYSFTNSSGLVLTTNRTVIVAAAVFNPPILANLARNGESVGFTLSGDLGQTVVIETCTNLVAPVWVPVQTNILGGASVNFSAPVQWEQPGQFYRLRTP